MIRWAFIGSYLLFNFVLISLLWSDAWLPQRVGASALVCIFIGWLVSAYFLFKYLGLTVRQEFIGWLFFVAFVGFSFARRLSNYYLFHSSWSMWLAWDAVGLIFIAASIGFAALISRKPSIVTATPYTVKSEAPDHVLHTRGKPN
jgi:hypothetical protein